MHDRDKIKTASFKGGSAYTLQAAKRIRVISLTVMSGLKLIFTHPLNAYLYIPKWPNKSHSIDKEKDATCGMLPFDDVLHRTLCDLSKKVNLININTRHATCYNLSMRCIWRTCQYDLVIQHWISILQHTCFKLISTTDMSWHPCVRILYIVFKSWVFFP